MIAAARQTILVCDSSKFGEICPHAVAPIDVVHRVITDEGIPPIFADQFALKGIEVSTVSTCS
jgi:DeoR/GlpR family transcriptional regulator of sugar metabolism